VREFFHSRMLKESASRQDIGHFARFES
jgi:hypothetical protein